MRRPLFPSLLRSLSGSRFCGRLFCMLFSLQAALLCAVPGPVHAAGAAPIPLEHFFRHPEYRSVQLSPDGKYLALIAPVADQERLVIIDRESMKLSTMFTFGANHSVAFYRWVRDDRVIVAPARKFGALDTPVMTGELYAGNADGSGKTQLLGPTLKGDNFSVWFEVQRVFDDGRDEIIVSKRSGYSRENLTSYTLNVYSGRLKRVGRSPLDNGTLAFDQQGQPRLALGVTDNNESLVLYRDEKGADWQEISRATTGEAQLSPLLFSADGRRLWALSDRGRATQALVLLDLAQPGANASELIADAVGDVSEVILDRHGKAVIGAWVSPSYPQARFIDDKHPDAQLQRALEAAFRNSRVEISSYTRDGKLATVTVTSDREPGAWYLLDTASRQLSPLLRAMPWLDSQQLVDRHAVKLNARDGLPLHGYLTLPRGQDKKLPLILLVHGGPHGPRDEWAFDPEAQFFASRGYAVLQMNFRGSGGYGRAFMSAGFGNWGTTMQDDLTDSVRWAVQEGFVDPQRVCIYGASYGGYAAVMSPIREPALYKCAVAYVGVYDLGLMFEAGDVPRRESGLAYLRRALGTDAERHRAQSPLHQLDRFKAALFLIHGEQDQRAHFSHYQRLKAALDARQYPHEYLTKPKEAHGFYDEQNRFELYTRMLAFFDRHLGVVR